MEPITIRLAVASGSRNGLDGRVGQHFGRCPAYTIVDVTDGRIAAAEVVDNPFAHGHAPGDVPSFVAGTAAQVLLTGGIGQRAIRFFDARGIQVSAGHTGTVAQAVASWLGGEAGGAAPCAGHGHDHEHDDGHGHGAGRRGCGSGS